MVSKFEWRVKTRGGGPYQRLLKNMEKLAKTNADLLQGSSEVATRVSRSTFASKRSGRPFTAERRGRRTTMGRLESHIVWIDGLELVVLDDEELEEAAPYYLINEVGTGRAATRGRHDAKGNVIRDTVKFPSQKGRHIKPGLAWGDNGNHVKSSSSRFRQDQIQPAARLSVKQGSERRRGKKRAVNPLRTQRVRISREIQPKHYIGEGARAGFDAYGQPIRDAARTTFNRKR